MKTKAGGSATLDNQNGVPSYSGASGSVSLNESNIIERHTESASGFTNDNQTFTSTDRSPHGVGPTGLLAVEQAYAKPTDASSPAQLVGDLPR